MGAAAALSVDEGTFSAEARLVAQLRREDAAAFEVMVRAFGGRLLAVARRILPSEADARDAVQEAFVAAFRALPGFAGNARLSTWLHRIVVNAALMKLRRQRSRAEEPIDDLLPRFEDDGHFGERPSDWHAPGHELLERAETRALVRRAIERLPETYRTVLVLRDVEELDTDEAALALGVTPNAVRTRLHRARQALRAIIEREMTPAR